MEFRTNDQLQLAESFLLHTDRNIFLTGKAGTGKTTFLHHLKEVSPKRMVVVAPTGVAAINAGGVTIHSFFQLNFGPIISRNFHRGTTADQKGDFHRKFHREKIKLLKCIDLLVIDEVSMVRADLLDAIDEVLRQYRSHSKPFGGVQLLMIGDLHQLAPVVKDAEWEILREFYPSAYFFDSYALKKSQPLTIELFEYFRQTDTGFISLLNKVRDSRITGETLELLNSRFIRGFEPKDEDGYIILTTHNITANNINQDKLKGVKGRAVKFKAVIEGDFPEQNFPTDPELDLKVNAQVMFIKNDPEPAKRFYNGKIGRITRFEEDKVYVECPFDNDEIEVNVLTWENVRYTLDDQTREIKEEIIGKFSQVPLKLAWAITIHKSQGLTFDKVIIDAGAAFAYGQVYVALSRCRTFEGIVLRTPLTGLGIKTDSLVQQFSIDAKNNKPGDSELQHSRSDFQRELVLELFNFNLIRRRLDTLVLLMKTLPKVIDRELISEGESRQNEFENEVYLVAEKFHVQLNGLLSEPVIPEENGLLQERIVKAAGYFTDKLKNRLYPLLTDIYFDTDNKAIKTQLVEAIGKVQSGIFLKISCFKAVANGFDTLVYLRARADAELDFRVVIPVKSPGESAGIRKKPHPGLYARLLKWREEYAGENNLLPRVLLPVKSINEIVRQIPETLKELGAIRGIGQTRIKRFGNEIMAVIVKYREEKNISRGFDKPEN